jgi:hypothetical protein
MPDLWALPPLHGLKEGSDDRSLWTSRLSRAFLDALRKELEGVSFGARVFLFADNYYYLIGSHGLSKREAEF